MAPEVQAAILGLFGAVVGGLLVVLGAVVTRRDELRQAQRVALRLAAADVVATYLHARGRLKGQMNTGAVLPEADLFPPERWLALARLFTLPGSEQLRDQVLELGAATLAVIEAKDRSKAEQGFERQLTAIRAFEASVRRAA